MLPTESISGVSGIPTTSCPQCSAPMDLKLVMPVQDGGEERSYVCPLCKHSHSYYVSIRTATS